MVAIATPITPLTKPPTTGGGFSLDLSFLGGTTFWVFVVVGLIFGIICFFWITRKERKDDPFMRDFRVKKNQCKMFKDDSLDKVYIENQKDGLIKLGKYEGEALDKEGYHNIMFSKLRFGKIGGFLRKVLFFTRPILDLLLKKYWIVRCNVNPVVFFNEENVMKDNKVRVTSKKYILPIPTITKGKGSLIMHCEGLQLKKYYTYPILRGLTGNIVKDEDKNFMRERDSVLIDTLYQQSVMGDTEIVYFKNGKLENKKIEDFAMDDNCMIQSFNPKTSKIELCKPSSFYKHKANKDGYEIVTSYNNVIRLTGDHSVFTWRSLSKGWKITKGKIIEAEVRNLKKGDWIVIPNRMPVVECDVREFDLSSCKNHKHIYKLKSAKKVRLTDDLLWTLGMFASEGWIDSGRSVCFSTESANFDKLQRIFKRSFGLEGREMNYFCKRKNGYKVRINRITFSSVVVVDMFKSLMHDRNWILQLPLRRLKYYVHGLWCGDGWHNGGYKKARQINITTSDRDEAEFIRKLFLRFGVLSGVYAQKYSGEFNSFFGLKIKNDEKYAVYHVTASGISQTDILKWDKVVNQSQQFKRVGDLSVVKINSMRRFRINGFVYDFSVPMHENFVGNNVCCHNTIDFSNAMREAINLNPNVRYVVKTEGRAIPEQGGG